jgi:hypothetical protein
VTCGNGLEDMVFDGPGNVLWLSAEDSAAHVLKPRLLAAGADQSRVFVVGEAFTFDEKGVELVRAMAERRKPTLIVIDPIFAYATGDASKGAYARGVTNQLKQVAEEFSCAIVLVRHVGKSKGFGDHRAAGLYSIEWRAAARSVLLCGSDPDAPHIKALTQSKNNLSPLAESIGFTLEEYPPGSEVSRALWTGVSQLTARRILAQVGDEDEKAETVNVEDFVRELLRAGEMLAAEVQAAARKNSIPERMLTRVKARLGVKSRREGFGPKAVYYWYLPDKGEEKAADETQNAPSTPTSAKIVIRRRWDYIPPVIARSPNPKGDIHAPIPQEVRNLPAHIGRPVHHFQLVAAAFAVRYQRRPTRILCRAVRRLRYWGAML